MKLYNSLNTLEFEVICKDGFTTIYINENYSEHDTNDLRILLTEALRGKIKRLEDLTISKIGVNYLLDIDGTDSITIDQNSMEILKDHLEDL